MRIRRIILMAIVAVAAGVIASPAQEKLAPGNYKGTYTGGAGGGDLRLALKADGKGGLTGEVGFTVGGEEVAVKMTSMKVDGSKVQMIWEFDLQGAKLQSASEGTLSGKTLSGTYKTSSDGQAVDQGTWTTTAQ
jgi:hypothetical protein